ncbi:hypothetical protein P775_13730 [Puniceibacterium antarcticum]|uniref:Methyl-accepting transducer domain-containing protein n=1 Tax=Puniceibacterium antarcticum TaxID=1206336 RepID=A0A2G8RDE7_9RHOB|nr:hypothetical protein [Puniceibacterium antarcticum]PIL19579.1 hypothetical protein P775_13730 [Puniceibacterium antarcticum]
MTRTGHQPTQLEFSEVGEGAHLHLAKALEQARGQIEAAFIRIGDKLANSVGVLNDLAATFEELPKDFESREMNAANAQLQALVTQSAQIAASIRQERPLMSALRDATTATHGTIAKLERSIMTIRIVALNARITAASTSIAGEQMALYSEEMPMLSSEASETVSAFAKLFSVMASSVEQAYEERRRVDVLQETRLSDLSTELGSYLCQIDRKRQDAAQNSSATMESSRNIASRISSVVLTLQVGDNIRQRIEHVEEGLRYASDIAAGKGCAAMDISGPLYFEQAELVSVTLVRMQEQQLRDVQASLEIEIGTARQAIATLARDVSQAMERAKELYSGTADGGSMVAFLSSRMRSAASLLDECAKDQARTEQLSNVIKKTVADLLAYVDQVKDIEVRMKLLSHNAKIKSNSMGARGKALNAISDQVRELTENVVVVAEAVIEKLQLAAQCSESLVASGDAFEHGYMRDLGKDALSAVGLLEAVDARLGRAASKMKSEGPKVSALLDAAALELSSQYQLAQTIGDVAARLNAALDNQCSLQGGPYHNACSDARWNDVCDAAFASLRQHYNMQSERQIHDIVLGLPTPSSESEDASLEFFDPQGEGDSDNFVDDVFF